MPKEPTPQEMFEVAGRALNPGGDWQAAVAELMHIRRDSVRQLKSGRMDLKPGHFQTLLSLLVERQRAMKEVEAELRQWLAKQPPSPPEERRP
jgi:hypothetical protein